MQAAIFDIDGTLLRSAAVDDNLYIAHELSLETAIKSRFVELLDKHILEVEIREAKHDKVFAEYPDESLAEWHQRLGPNSKR